MTDERHAGIMAIVAATLILVALITAFWHNAYVNQKLVASGYCPVYQVTTTGTYQVWQKCPEVKAEGK